MGFADNLKTLMVKNKTSNYKLAKAIGCSNTTIANWLIGVTPGSDMIQKVAEYYKTTTDLLLGAEGQKEKPTPVSEDGLSARDKYLIDWFYSLPLEKRQAILAVGDGPKELAD